VLPEVKYSQQDMRQRKDSMRHIFPCHQDRVIVLSDPGNEEAEEVSFQDIPLFPVYEKREEM
jgi:hypothetical protein